MTKPRKTPQKRAIQEVFEQSNRPLTVQEVHASALRLRDGLGVATVYRAVSRLVAEEWLREVHLPGQPVRYERGCLDHHHHFHCGDCERVLDIAAPCEDLGSHLPSGFQARRHEVTFYGTCADCSEVR